MIKPTFTGRRSKEERAALEKEAIEREKARTKEQADADRRKQKEADRKTKREQERASRGRGGYSGAMSGPFSLGSSREGMLYVEVCMRIRLTFLLRSQNKPPYHFRIRRRFGLPSDTDKERRWWRRKLGLQRLRIWRRGRRVV